MIPLLLTKYLFFKTDHRSVFDEMEHLSALCHHCLVQFVLLVLPMNLFSVVPISVFLFPMFTLSFCFMSSLSGPVCTLSVANKQIFCFSDFRLTFLTQPQTPYQV